MHLLRKAFFPGRPPIPLLHVDTTWKFREMIEFRDQMATKLGFDLLVHINPEGIEAISHLLERMQELQERMREMELRVKMFDTDMNQLE